MKNKEKIYQITSIVLIIDQIIKLLINNFMKIGEEIKIINNLFSLYFVKNTGAAFSILENETTFLIIFSVLIILVLNHFIKKEKNFTKLESISLGLIMGGIFGNLIDRILHHGVIDYLSFTIFKYKFPVFNFADIAICLGTIILLIATISTSKKERNYARLK